MNARAVSRSACARLALVLVLAPLSRADLELQKLVAPDAAASDRFGQAIAIDGDTLVVGAPFDDDHGADSGAVYVFTRTAGVWAPYAKLVAPDGAASAEFGCSVAIDGGRILVGAWRHDVVTGISDYGAAYTFVESGSVWTFEQMLVANDPAPVDHFGTSVALLGNRALVGAVDDDDGGSRSGSAYVFAFGGAAWSQEAKLVANVPHAADAFGSSVALEETRALIGAAAVQNGGIAAPGSAYVFVRAPGGTWSEEQRFQSPIGQQQDHFGQSVDIEGDFAVVGAPEIGRGWIYAYRRVGGTWILDGDLYELDSTQFRRIGYSVAIEGDLVVAGAPNDDTFGLVGSGCAYLYRRMPSGVWHRDVRLGASDATYDDNLGHCVAMNGVDVVLGAPRDDHVAADAGSVCTFVTPPHGTFGTSFCFGDGTGTACPCGNTSAVGAGQGCNNTSGQGADLDAWGSTSVAADDLRIGLSHMYIVPPGFVPGILAVGSNVASGGFGTPFGAGLRCLAAPTRRLGIQPARFPGIAAWGPGLRALGQWNAGETQQFQVWYRANAASAPCGQAFNLSSALSITFTP